MAQLFGAGAACGYDAPDKNRHASRRPDDGPVAGDPTGGGPGMRVSIMAAGAATAALTIGAALGGDTLRTGQARADAAPAVAPLQVGDSMLADQNPLAKQLCRRSD